MPADVLYIHPAGHLNDLVVPAGALSCLNAVSAAKLGRYAFELADDEVRSARIVAVDLHWAVALPGFARLVRHVRSVNPAAAIVIGGITAGHYAQDLLERHPVDFVIQGDSETRFAALVQALLADADPAGIPNVHARGAPLPLLGRMTDAEFDRTDSLTCSWFPTFARVTDWDAAAFGQGRTISVARGCPRRCPACYGSFAATFGPGLLVRSSEALAALLRRARDEGVRNLRLILGRIPAETLARLLAGAAAAGPFALDTSVGLYLCTPPDPGDLDALEESFPNGVTLSLVPPDEHVPVLAPDAVAAEMDRWRQVVRRVARSRVLSIDAWATSTADLERLRRNLGAAGTPRATVSLGAVWSVTRPNDGGERPDLEDLQAAMEPLWTFFAARLLSPPLARALAPFRFLDEIQADPESASAPIDGAAAWWPVLMGSWRLHRLPLLPGLGFAAVPVRAGRGTRHLAGTRFTGDLAAGEVEALPGAQPWALAIEADHRGVGLWGEGEVPAGADALAIVALPPGGSPPTGPSLADEVVFLRCPRGAGRLDVTLRVQDAGVAWRDETGAPRARGRADLAWFRAPRHSGMSARPAARPDGEPAGPVRRGPPP